MSTHAHPNNVGNVKKGTARPQAKLLEYDVMRIRQLYGNPIQPDQISTTHDGLPVGELAARGKWTYKALAWQFDVAFSTIGQIVRRETWTHVE